MWGYRTSATVLCELSRGVGGWGGGLLECFCSFFTTLFGGSVGRVAGIQCVAITFAQPLLSGYLLLSSFHSFSLPVGVRIGILRASCCL